MNVVIRYGAVLLLLTTAPAAAQQKTPAAEREGVAGAAVSSATDPAALRDLIGRNVENAAGERIGEIEDVVLQDGRRSVLIVSVGGFLGIGEKLVTVPYDEVTMTSDGILVNLTRGQLKRQPAYDPRADAGTSLKASRGKSR